MRYDCNAILNVGELDLAYVDEYEDLRLISLEDCGRRAPAPDCVARRLRTVDSQGQRGWSLAFFTEPTTVFHARTDQELQRAVWRLEQMGWKVL
ncbi:MAG: hypothetical protein J4G17_13200 [Anaerolineae bacterium]|nr:hypothetical protein [Anaerolineae bacterium]